MFLTKRNKEYKKVVKVIQSCQTLDQLLVALDMIKLFLNKCYLVDHVIMDFNMLFAKDDYIHPLLDAWDNKYAQIELELERKGDDDEN